MNGRTPRLLLVVLGACAAAVARPVGTRAQDAGPRIAVVGSTLSADTIALGDRFELRVDVRLAPGSVAFLPDSVVGRGFEPFGPVEWTAREAPGGATALAVVYPLIAFGTGTVEIPDFEVYGASAEEGIAAGLSRADQPVGDFEAFVGNVALVPSARLSPVPAHRLEVTSVLFVDGAADAIRPRPPADVAGGDRDWPATLLTLFFGLAFLGVTGATVRDWAAARSAVPPPPPPSPRSEALAALDALLSSGLLAAGRTRDFFTRSSEITRRYVETFEARWGPAWTGTELMNDLVRREGAVRAREKPDPEPLREEIATAERVKFGGLRPDPAAAEEHARHVRAWIDATAPHDDAVPVNGTPSGDGTP